MLLRKIMVLSFLLLVGCGEDKKTAQETLWAESVALLTNVEKIGDRFAYMITYDAHLGQGAPNSSALRAGSINLATHLAYISYLVERRTWLAGDRMTMADLCAAAHLSCLDYFGDVPWDKHEQAKEWYARIKSRPCFRSLLLDSIPGMIPSRHYNNLDF